jgi:hypothetical protein
MHVGTILWLERTESRTNVSAKGQRVVWLRWKLYPMACTLNLNPQSRAACVIDWLPNFAVTGALTAKLTSSTTGSQS